MEAQSPCTPGKGPSSHAEDSRHQCTGPVLAGIGTEDRRTVFSWYRYRYRPDGNLDRPRCSSGGGGSGVGGGCSISWDDPLVTDFPTY